MEVLDERRKALLVEWASDVEPYSGRPARRMFSEGCRDVFRERRKRVKRDGKTGCGRDPLKTLGHIAFGRGAALLPARQERQPTGATGPDDHRRRFGIQMNADDARARPARGADGRLDRAASPLPVELHARQDGLRACRRTRPARGRPARATALRAPFFHGGGVVGATERATGPGGRPGAANRFPAVAAGAAPEGRRTRGKLVAVVLTGARHVAMIPYVTAESEPSSCDR